MSRLVYGVITGSRRSKPGTFGGGGGGAVSTFTLTTAATTGTYPFMTGVAFKKGDVPASFTTDLSQYSVTIKRTWNDGSVKHAIITGRAALTQNVARTITISTGTPPTGTNLTATDIATAAPSASIQCGGLGTINISSLLASPFRTWVSTPEMVECHYRADIGSELNGWFQVRLFADGRLWVRCIVENGYLDNGSGSNTTATDRSYVPTLSINGSTVYNNGGSSLTHYKRTRYMAEAWINGDPQITAIYNVTYLRSTKLVPNYAYPGTSSGILNALTQTYTPMGRGGHIADQGSTGFANHIGIVPNWEAMFLANGDARALRSTLVNSSHLNSYAICMRSKTAQVPLKPSSFSTWNIDGVGSGGSDSTSTSANIWEYNHHPSAGFLAYMLTGDYWHYETMLLNAACCYLLPDNGNNGSGTSRLLRRQTRGTAWAMRTVGQLCGIAPSSDIGAGNLVEDYRTLLQSNYTAWQNTINAVASMTAVGSVYQYTYGPGGGWDYPAAGSPTGSVAPWMTDFWVMTNGHISDLEPLATMTTILSVRDHMYRWIVGRLGQSGVPAEYDFTEAAMYGIKVATSDAGTTWYQDWGTIYTQTFGSTNSSGSNTLVGGNIGNGQGGVDSYWGNLVPAIAYAVEHGAVGASAAYARLTGATNWNTIASEFPDIPVWGIAPRS